MAGERRQGGGSGGREGRVQRFDLPVWSDTGLWILETERKRGNLCGAGGEEGGEGGISCWRKSTSKTKILKKIEQFGLPSSLTPSLVSFRDPTFSLASPPAGWCYLEFSPDLVFSPAAHCAASMPSWSCSRQHTYAV